MALIRGSRGLFPCPICFVPLDKQSDLTQVYDLRTARDSQNTLKAADELEYNYQRELILKAKGLRYIKASGNTFDLGILIRKKFCIECFLANA
jgi:hypothetical protein